MPFFAVTCPYCKTEQEFMQGPNDEDKEELCDVCGEAFARRGNTDYSKHRVAMHGNCTGGAGSVQWAGYYDSTLGAEINSKQHRKDLMEQKGVEEYHTDPDVDRHTDEAQYIRSHSGTGDADAKAAATKCVKAAATVQREKNIDAAFDRADVA